MVPKEAIELKQAGRITNEQCTALINKWNGGKYNFNDIPRI